MIQERTCVFVDYLPITRCEGMGMNEKRSGKPFHLSIGVKSLEESANFFESVLGAQITHDDVYVNLSLYGNQITLKSNPNIVTALPDFHFGINLSIDEFRLLEKKFPNTILNGSILR